MFSWAIDPIYLRSLGFRKWARSPVLIFPTILPVSSAAAPLAVYPRRSVIAYKKFSTRRTAQPSPVHDSESQKPLQTFELPGFKTLMREDVIVEVGKTATISPAIEVATSAETVTVTGNRRSPMSAPQRRATADPCDKVSQLTA